jgi:Xaa-Pro aminopeptidase
VLERHGLARFFTHGLGHGVGIDIHERPRLAMNSPDLVEEGHVVTVEPGVYIPGRIGIRCEDMAVIGRRGPALITRAPRDITVV